MSYITAYDEKRICRDLPAVKGDKWCQSLSDAGVYVHDNVSEPISLLIGADIAGRLYTGKIHQTEQGPTASETKLGWVLLGKDSTSEQSSHTDATLAVFTMFSENAKITDLWDLDVLGIRDPVETLSKEAHQAKVVRQFQETTRLNEEGRYEVHLPWKENHPPLSNNRASVEKRLVRLTSKLHDEHLYDDYQAVFDSWLSDGIIEQISVNEIENSGYYLPHRHVVKENSSTRIRLVFDASASCNDGPSLNQCLETGPNLIELITNILLRFMRNKIGVAADIKKAFLQIEVTPADRDVLKFLWWKRDSPHEMIVYRHRRVVFGVNGSPFLLGATIELHLDSALKNSVSNEEEEIIKKLKKSFYVDNCVASVQSPEEESKFRSTATEVMLRAFDLRGWERTHDDAEKSKSSILGLIWDKRNDCLLINACFTGEIKQPLKKKKILSTAHKIFDPLGWACPTLLCPKLLLQQLWSKNLAWDTEVPHEVAMEFTKWQSQLSRLAELKIKRWIFEGVQENSAQLHMFVDASKYAYAAALFIRIPTSQGDANVHLIQAKARVAPTKKVSIPRMEILAATLGARLMSTARKTLELLQAQEFFWSDSTTTLSWITRNKQRSRLILNRVQEIRELTDVAAWRHVPGELNPADLPSRGCSVSQLVESQWWNGPAWLKLAESE
ncbi:uncharacterized protein LOC106652657 [Trichogramma pretiosum]|uniref:uncharacterized protein LOC106652657 n=1 Tax=Trichogramma pretiosum TaxID=7493 RepID=UPI000C718DE4|nr:uncharacterized protein LOC106652657 [Trichogramma pretiosum]